MQVLLLLLHNPELNCTGLPSMEQACAILQKGFQVDIRVGSLEQIGALR